MNNESKKKTKQEKLGFYIALSVCLVAVGLAAWSTFDSVSKYIQTDETEASVTSTLAPVDNNVTGVTETLTAETTPSEHTGLSVTQPVTEEDEKADEPDPEETQGETEDALQTLLRVTESLQYPVSSKTITREYSEDAVKNETMNDWRPHTGVDFGSEEGEPVLSMCDGIVKETYTDGMLGNVVVVENDELVIRYCGLDDDVEVKSGDEVAAGDQIGKAGTVPFEEKDESHIHVEITVNNRYIDPVSVIDNNE